MIKIRDTGFCMKLNALHVHPSAVAERSVLHVQFVTVMELRGVMVMIILSPIDVPLPVEG